MEQQLIDRPASTGSDYYRIQRALERLVSRFPEQPSLAELAAEVGLGEHHFQRMFSAWAGVSPKKFMQHLSLQAAKQRLDESASVLDAAFEAGLSGPGRLHDLFVGLESVTPGEYKARGEGMSIRYGFHDSPFGECLLMVSPRGVCGLAFTDPEGRDMALARLSHGWERASIVRDEDTTAPFASRIFAPAGAAAGEKQPLRLLVRGSRFQLSVWRALLTVPPGALITYAELARRIGLPPGAARAVGTANGANAIAWLIPCHRVIRATGAMGGYRWGEARKLAMIGWEAVATEDAA
jgi:AraC family transcriptional regulator of adaptative response/methylated-DNA-[protein]-cysteine methyltransferase